MFDEITDLFEVLSQVIVEHIGRFVPDCRNVRVILELPFIEALGGQYFFASILKGFVIEAAEG